MGTIRERLLEERVNYELLSDEQLAFEAASFEENIESVRLELRLYRDGQVERLDGWQVRAERSLAMLKGRAALCRAERDKRKRLAWEQRTEQNRLEEEQRQLEREERRRAHQQFVQESMERKQERLSSFNKPRTFVRLARQMLPPETFAAIWDAVEKANGHASEVD